MVTIKDVAEKAGMTKSSVSKILNGHTNFKKETIAKVLQCAEELGYSPNQIARALGKRESKTIALILPIHEVPVFSSLQGYLEKELYEAGYKLLLCNSLADKEKEEQIIALLERNMIDGIILGSFVHDFSHLLSDDLPIVTVGRKIHDQIPAVMADNYAAGMLAARHLLARRCTDVLYITGYPGGLAGDERYQGFKAVMDKSGIQFHPYETTLKMQLEMNSSEVISQMITEHPSADGIFAETDVLAMSCIQLYTSLSYRIPEEVKIVGFGNQFFGRLMNPPVTTIDENRKEIARIAVETLLKKRNKGEEAEYEVKVPVSLVERKST